MSMSVSTYCMSMNMNIYMNMYINMHINVYMKINIYMYPIQKKMYDLETIQYMNVDMDMDMDMKMKTVCLAT